MIVHGTRLSAFLCAGLTVLAALSCAPPAEEPAPEEPRPPAATREPQPADPEQEAAAEAPRPDEDLSRAAIQNLVLELVEQEELAERGYQPERMAFMLGKADEAAVVQAYRDAVEPGAELDPATLEHLLHDINKAIVAHKHEAARTRYQDDPDVKVWRGAIAERNARRVKILAEATGLRGGAEPPEFFIISEKSGHDYESLSVAFVQPSELHEALRFIGMEPGRPVQPDQLKFWPKGERALFTFTAYLGEDMRLGPLRMEKLFLDRDTNEPLPETGLVFTGSLQVSSPDDPDKTVYAADRFGPHAIAANYNEPTAMFDVPRQAPQHVVYGNFQVNPEHVFPPLAFLEIVIEPKAGKGEQTVVDLTLEVRKAETPLDAPAGALALSVLDNEGTPLLQDAKTPDVLALFSSLRDDGRDPFVNARFARDVPLGPARDLCGILASIDSEHGIRVEPPDADQLYYRAFVPNPEFKDRGKRMAQPWELHLERENGTVAGTLVHIEQESREQERRPTLDIARHAVDSGESLETKLEEIGPGLAVILIYAPPDLLMGELLDFVAPIRDTHPTLHVFVVSD